MTGWYLMYWRHPQRIGDVGRYELAKISGVREWLDEETRAKALELARSIWCIVKENDPDAGFGVGYPHLVWRTPLESILDEPVSVDSGIHDPDETAEYEEISPR